MTSTPATRRGVWFVLIGVAVAAGVTAAVISALESTDALAATGLNDPGPITSFGLPLFRAAGEIAAVTAIGHFLFAAFLAAPQSSGVLDVDGYRALRIGAVACAIWALCAALLVALTVSDVSGLALKELTPLEVWSAAGLVEITAAWRTTSILAAVVAVTAFTVLRWSWTPALLLGGVATLVPLAVTGHSSSGGAHDVATNSMFIHLIAGTLWAGGLLALLGHALRGGSHTDVAARRFSGLALWCFAAMAISGIVNAATRIQPTDIGTSTYGLLIVGKVATLIGLGVVGWRQRRTSIVALQSDPTARRPLVWLALTEAALFAVAIGLAVGLGRTPPPPPTGKPSPAEVALGFDLPDAPTITTIFVGWRFDLIFGSAAIVMASVYLAGVLRVRRRGDPWSSRRTVCWIIGCLAMLFTTSSGLGKYMTAMFSMHTVVQLLLSTAVPALLVWGTPATLALRALRAADPDAPPGPREWLQCALDSSAARLITRPWIALALFLVGVYGLALPDVFDVAVSEHPAHMATIAYFLLSGALLFSTVRAFESVGKLHVAVLLLALSSFAPIGMMVMNTHDVLGQDFFRSLKLDWHADLLDDQKLGGVISATFGVSTTLIASAILLAHRYRGSRFAR